ncbi:hypothetical protein QTO34_007852 [Cnephaeus nilssonii]|uniref:Jun dimerization protein 2 n=1 Tax=Cnephaeus nilssonii TaxID=3371016 RepID=A0AA40HK75_CNENI|nr:hypothetical protein QTO34_007852 [Eptesicus nilssonii]
MNAELKTQMEELKQERQQLILMLNQHRPTCIIRIDSVKTLTQKATHCWSSWRRSDHGLGGGKGSSLLHENSSMRLSTASIGQAFVVKLRSATPGEETQADETQDQMLRPK